MPKVDATNIGIAAAVLISQSIDTGPDPDVNLSITYTSISLSFNVILTLVFLVRFVLRHGNIRAATGSPTGLSGLCKTTATMFIESSALYAINSLLLIGVRGASSSAEAIFLPVLGQVQVRDFLRPWSSGRFVQNDDGLDRLSLHFSSFNAWRTRAR